MTSDIPLQKIQNEVTDGLLGCLMILCRIHGVAISSDALTAGLPLHEGRLSPALFKRAAERANFASSVLKNRSLPYAANSFQPYCYWSRKTPVC